MHDIMWSSSMGAFLVLFPLFDKCALCVRGLSPLPRGIGFLPFPPFESGTNERTWDVSHGTRDGGSIIESKIRKRQIRTHRTRFFSYLQCGFSPPGGASFLHVLEH